ncbi:beta-ketoacyl-ACP synthase [Dongshaea marina]|uniref:beta-ketoacyl-ACP synthase n=1 Tax=Dongshaea marina TaxID=2047966 RepID=UPI000D3E283B|nr:beta-ketoacyl-ACP synthase [Dongshaea marina]
MKRVVVTGMSSITSLGQSWPQIRQSIEQGKTGIRYMADWAKFDGLNTNLGGPVNDFELPSHYGRKQVRSMGRVSRMATLATERALEQAGLLKDPILESGQTGISYGSSIGSTSPLSALSTMLNEHSTRAINATTYIQLMPHTTAVNVSLFFGLKGRVYTTSSACTSGSQGIGYAYEAIKHGQQTVMIAGGAEELCPTEAAVFDTLFATSVKNDTPQSTPRPFDQERDGLVIGEGAGTLILEEYEYARQRGATILAEIVGYGTNCDAQHITQPTAETMQVAIELALKDAQLNPDQIGYVSAHGTATERGDIAETTATERVFGSRIPISSMKSYFGHTLGACGAIEAHLAIEMMRENWFAPTINLAQVDPRCGSLDYIQDQGRMIHTDLVMSNNFAFGGINTSLIFRRG